MFTESHKSSNAVPKKYVSNLLRFILLGLLIFIIFGALLYIIPHVVSAQGERREEHEKDMVGPINSSADDIVALGWSGARFTRRPIDT